MLIVKLLNCGMLLLIPPVILGWISLLVLVPKSLAQSDGDLRLVNGTTPCEGRVEMYYNTQWLAMSKGSFGGNVSRVVCRQLGFPAMASRAVVRYFGRHVRDRPLLEGYVNCKGNEDRLTDCNGFDWNRQSVVPSYVDNDLGVVCKAGDGDLRLVNGTSPTDECKLFPDHLTLSTAMTNEPHITTNEGRIEMYYDNTWTTINRGSVSSTNHMNFARVICRQLRLPFTQAQTVTDINVFGGGEGEVMMANISCKSSDSQLIDCNIGRVQVGREKHLSDIGVTCKGDYIGSGDIRLVNGSLDHRRGRLEIYLMNEWASFCSIHSRFTVNEATVACRQLGINTTIPVVIPDDYYGSTGNISYFTSCSGNESRIDHCPSLYLSSPAAPWGDICEGSSDISMCCLDEPGICGSKTYPEFDVTGFISAFVSAILVIVVFCCFCCCCCCWCWRRNKRKHKYSGVSQNPTSQPIGGTPSNQIQMAKVEGPDVPPVYVHPQGQHTHPSTHPSGMTPYAAGGSSPYPQQPVPHPTGQVPPPVGAYPAPQQPGYNPAAAASMQYPPQQPATYPPQPAATYPPPAAAPYPPQPAAPYPPPAASPGNQDTLHQPGYNPTAAASIQYPAQEAKGNPDQPLPPGRTATESPSAPPMDTSSGHVGTPSAPPPAYEHLFS